MFSQYADLEIYISALSESRYSVSISGPGGEASGALVLPTQDPTYQALATQLATLDTEEETLGEIGQLLFQSLFQGAIKDVYVRSQGMLEEDQGLRLRMNIAASEVAVSALPWEFLYDPDQGPLALLDTPVMRYLPQSARVPTLQTELPLKVLLTGAHTPPATDVERELADVVAALSELGDHVQITVEPHLTTGKLQQLLRGNYHIWHFVGHGGYAKDGTTGRLFFEDAAGDTEAVSAMQLGILLNRSGLRLVMLDACEGGRLATDPFRSVAPALVRAQVPAVVAMQFSVPQDATRAFAGEFYRALAEGFPIDACVTEGRKAVMSATGLRNPDWGIPVVYTRAHDGHLFALPNQSAPAAAPPAAQPPAPVAVPVAAPIPEIAAAPAIERRAINLPATTTALVGRNQDIVAARRLLQRGDVRLLTLTGPGGTGKTRLAIQIASDLLDSFDHGMCFVDLAPVGQRDLVITTIAHTLGVAELGEQALLATLIEYLAQRQLLLVLDNFEQVLEAAPLLAELLAHAPRLEIIVTSRAALRISGEYEFPVEPLALPNLKRLPALDELGRNPAVALFVERARAIKPSFALTQSNAQAVAEICARLDGLPLAIELAAVRCNVLTPQALLARLNSRLDLLTGGARDLAARQQTLRGAIAWSYDLLNQAERTLFARLAVFTGGCSLEAAERVCATIETDQQGQVALGGPTLGAGLAPVTVDVLDTIGSLVDKSLLRQIEVRDEPRFVMLETIREYAQLRLATGGETAALRRQHAAYYLELAERAEPELVGADQVDWLQVLEDEHDNFRAALQSARQSGTAELAVRLSGALARFWLARGYLSDGRRWLEDALAQYPAPLDPASANPAAIARARPELVLRAKALNAAGILAWRQGDYARAQECYADNLAVFRQLGDAPGIARALNNLGILALYGDDYDPAQAYFEEALALHRRSNDRLEIANVLNNLGTIALHRADYRQAQHYFTDSLAIFRALGNALDSSTLLGNLAEVAILQGDYRRAQAYLLEGIELSRALGDREGIESFLDSLAVAAAAQGQPLKAAQFWGAAELLRETIGEQIPPSELIDYERAVVAARAQASTDDFDRAWAEGRAMPLEQVLELAKAG